MKKIIKITLLMWIALTVFSGSALASKKDLIGDVEFRDINVQDAVRILSELSGKNVIVTKDASDINFSLYIRNASLTDAIDSMCRVTGLWYRKDAQTNVYIVMSAEQFKEDVLVYRNESTKVFTLKHQNVVSAANAIEALFGDRVLLQAPKNDDGSYQFDGDMNDSSTTSTNSNNNTNNQNNYTNSNANNRNSKASELAGEVESLDNISMNKFNQIGAKEILKESDVTGLVQAAPIRVTYNSLHNLLLVRSSDDKALEDVQNLIAEIDQPAKQVLLQMKIMRVALGEDESSVFDFQYTDPKTVSGPNSSLISNPLSGSGIPQGLVGLGMQANQMASGSLVFQVANSDWLAKLAFLESEQRTKLVSTPLIMAANNKEAEIFVGEERPLVENISASGGSVSNGVVQPIVISTETTKKQVGTKLKIWPRINSDATVTLDIEQEISSINVGAATIPVATGGSSLEEYAIDTFTTTNLNLTAVAKHGQTIAIGGLIEENTNNSKRKIPGLSDISLFGDLFSNDEDGFSRSELVILIKPYIYDSVDLNADGLKNVRSQLDSEESQKLIDKEIREHESELESSIESQNQKLQLVASQIKELLRSEYKFDNKMGLDWQYEGLKISSLGSVKKGDLFFSLVLVTNNDISDKQLNAKSLGDYWLGTSWLFNKTEQKTVILENKSRKAIILSKQPLEAVLRQNSVSVRYVLTRTNK